MRGRERGRVGPVGRREYVEDSKDFYIAGEVVKTAARGDGGWFDRERVVSDT